MEQKTLQQRHNYVLLDVARVYCACLVVVLHSMEMATKSVVWNVLQQCFFPQAVPFFFTVSGFFLAKKIYASSDVGKTVMTYVKKQGVLYLAWAALWTPSLVLIYRAKYPDASVSYFLMLMARRLFLAGEGVYWYILVLAEAAIVIGVLIRLRKEKLLYALALIGLLLRYAYDGDVSLPGFSQLNHLFYVVFSWSNNVVMMGLPFMAVGVFFARSLDRIRTNGRTLAIVYLLASGCHIALYFLHPFKNFPVAMFYPVQTVTLFLFCVQTGSTVITPGTARALRECSAVIYFMHTVFIYEVFDRFFTVNAPIAMKFFGSIGLSLLTYAFVKYCRIRPLGWLLGVSLPPKAAAERGIS